MRTADVVTLFDYLYWARDAVLRAAAELSAREFTSTDTVATRDLRATLVHELDVQWSWRERLRGQDWAEWGPDAELAAEDYPTLDAVTEHWTRDEVEMRAWLPSRTRSSRTSVPPHSPQNFAVGSLVAPQVRQASARRAPHSPQNLRPTSLAWPQLGQFIRLHPAWDT